MRAIAEDGNEITEQDERILSVRKGGINVCCDVRNVESTVRGNQVNSVVADFRATHNIRGSRNGVADLVNTMNRLVPGVKFGKSDHIWSRAFSISTALVLGSNPEYQSMTIACSITMIGVSGAMDAAAVDASSPWEAQVRGALTRVFSFARAAPEALVGDHTPQELASIWVQELMKPTFNELSTP